MCNRTTMCMTANSWPLLKCSGTGDTIYIKLRIQSRSTLITPISCTGRTLEITTEEWHAGMQNLWNMTLNWYTSQAKRMDRPTCYQDAQIMIKATTTTKD